MICGDWNIAHKEIDLKNWRSNQKNSGFLPEERAWLSGVFDSLGYVDVFRRLDTRPEQYTWWSNRGQAWAKNVGWRLDYQIATPGIAATARAASDLQGAALFRSRAAHHRLRLHGMEVMGFARCCTNASGCTHPARVIRPPRMTRACVR